MKTCANCGVSQWGYMLSRDGLEFCDPCFRLLFGDAAADEVSNPDGIDRLCKPMTTEEAEAQFYQGGERDGN